LNAIPDKQCSACNNENNAIIQNNEKMNVKTTTTTAAIIYIPLQGHVTSPAILG